MNSFVSAVLIALALAGCDASSRPSGAAIATADGAAAPAVEMKSGVPVVPHSVQPAKIFKVGGDVRAPRVLKRVQVDIPTSMENKRYQLGLLLLSAVIDETGKVREVKALNHQNAPLTRQHIEALRQWQFEPGTFRGNPVAVELSFSVGHFPVSEAP